MRNRGRLIAAFAGVIATCVLAAPASAARSIVPPQWFTCGTYYPATISIGPPRIWSSYNRPEHVIWRIHLERWNGSTQRWYTYDTYVTHSTFDWYGHSVTSWASEATSTGGRYLNSALHLRVSHVGYYRVAVAIGGTDSNVKWIGYVRGGAHCYIN